MKKSESGVINDFIFIYAYRILVDVKVIMDNYKILGVFVVDDKGLLIGILINRDVRFEIDLSKKVGDVMIKMFLVIVYVGISLDEVSDLMYKYKIEKLFIVDKDNVLKGLIMIKDI